MKIIPLLILSAFTLSGFAQEKQDRTKRDYNLFRPTPKDQMRGFETDRPDATESAYTVDAGHFQYETDLFKIERSTTNGITTTGYTINGFNMKFGITNSLDLQVVAETFVSIKNTGESSSKTNTGFEMLTIRVKQNIWGNDNGKSALAILPFVNFPTTPDNKISGGIVVPFGLSLPNNWGLGSQVEVDFETNQPGNGTHLNYLASATISHPLFTRCDFFAEAYALMDNGLKSYDYSLNAGLVYELKENIKLDSGLYYGLKNTSSKVFFVGLSFRF